MKEKRTYKHNCELPDYVMTIHNLMKSRGYEIYLVGGCVRDMLLERTPDDYDFCCSASPEEIVQVLRDNNIEYDASGSIVGYVIAIINNEKIDFVKFKGNSLEEDLCNRDFTMNAMAYDIDSREIVDYMGGKEDMENKIIRCCDERSIEKNPRTIFRAIRFAIQFGFRIDEKTYDSMKNNVPALEHIRISALMKDTAKLLKYSEKLLLAERDSLH